MQPMVGALALVCAFVRNRRRQVKVVLFGATGMVGQGVLRECMLDPDVDSVLAVVRSANLPDTLGDFGSIEARSDTEGCDRVRECRCRYSFVGVVLYVTLSDVACVFLPQIPQSRQDRLRRYTRLMRNRQNRKFRVNGFIRLWLPWRSPF